MYHSRIGCSIIPLPLVPAESAYKAVKVVQRKLRIRVLDLRSGQPLKQVPVAEVLVAPSGETFDEKKHRAARYWGTDDWDIEKNYIIPANAEGDPKNWNGFTKNDKINLQRALVGLGYDPGTPSRKFGNQGYAALKAFQLDWYADNGAEPPDAFERKVTIPWQRRIILAYNAEFMRSVQFQLAALGYTGSTDPAKSCEDEEGAWGPMSKKALSDFQRWEHRASSPYTTFNSLRSILKRKQLAKRLKAAHKSFVTDKDGVLHVAVPVLDIQKGFKLRVRFRDFALIAEEKGWRTASAPGATNFRVEWADTQTDPAWGWRLRPQGDTRAITDLPEFQSRLETECPGVEDFDWRGLTDEQLTDAKFSPFFRAGGAKEPEINLFGLVWCQPVWDGIEDPAAPNLTNQQALVENERNRNWRMHLVTRFNDLGGTDAYGGKGYGKFEQVVSTLWRSNDSPGSAGGHAGLDVHGVVGDSIFAVHAGKATPLPDATNTTVGGNRVRLRWKGSGRVSITYLHLSAIESATAEWVQAGKKLGEIGRTGNLGLVSLNPTHLHTNVGGSAYAPELVNTPDADNQACIPNNDTPLLFPCQCEVTQASANWNPNGCDFANTFVASSCWAVAELTCPFMGEAGQEDRRAQAQLRHLFENSTSTPNPFVHPGQLDGSLGPVPATAAAATASRRAIRAFRVHAKLTPATAPATEGFELDDATRAALDAAAPVTEPA